MTTPSSDPERVAGASFEEVQRSRHGYYHVSDKEVEEK